jgi:hypothetical protein
MFPPYLSNNKKILFQINLILKDQIKKRKKQMSDQKVWGEFFSAHLI